MGHSRRPRSPPLACGLGLMLAAVAGVPVGPAAVQLRAGWPRPRSSQPVWPAARAATGNVAAAAASRSRPPPCCTPLFATSVYRRRLRAVGGELGALNRELAVETRQLLELDEEGRRWSGRHYPGGYTSFGSLSALHRMSSTFGQLEQWLNHHVRDFAEYLEFESAKSLVMTDCWVNLMPKGAAHSLHIHPSSTISGAYYVQTPPGCPGLRFEDPRLERMMAAPRRRPSARRANRQLVEYPARAGDVVLFESWLRHSVAPSAAAAERISVSFNYHWC